MNRLRTAIAVLVVLAISAPAATPAQTPPDGSEGTASEQGPAQAHPLEPQAKPPQPQAKPPQPQAKPPQPQAKPPQPQAKPPQPQSVPAPPEASDFPVQNLVIGLGAVTSVVLLGTGVLFAISSSKRASEADALERSLEAMNGPNPCRVPGDFAAACSNLTALRASESRFAYISMGTFIAGGTLGVGTVVYTIVTLSRPQRAGVEVRPAVGAGSVGLTLRGQW